MYYYLILIKKVAVVPAMVLKASAPRATLTINNSKKKRILSNTCEFIRNMALKV